MKPWSQVVSGRVEAEGTDRSGTWPVRCEIGLCVCMITSNQDNVYLKAAKYGIPWTVHVGILRDKVVQHENKLSGLPVCDHCDGTGNEMFAFYRKCPMCKGQGIIAKAQA